MDCEAAASHRCFVSQGDSLGPRFGLDRQAPAEMPATLIMQQFDVGSAKIKSMTALGKSPERKHGACSRDAR